MTGIPTIDILNKIVELFKKENSDIRIHHLSAKERIILVFVKLKQDLSFSVLAVLFNSISVSSCRSIYLTTVPILHAIFDNLIFWPSKAEIMANIP